MPSGTAACRSRGPCAPPRPAATSAGVRQMPVERRDQLLDRSWPPGAPTVRFDWRRVLQQRLGDLPEPVDAIGVGEQRLIADHRVEYEPLVALQRVRGRERVSVLED